MAKTAKVILFGYEPWECHYNVAILPLDIAEDVAYEESNNRKYFTDIEEIVEYDTLEEFCEDHGREFKICKQQTVP